MHIYVAVTYKIVLENPENVDFSPHPISSIF